MTLDITWMPGPTDEARALQLKQCQLNDTRYDVLNDIRSRIGYDAPFEQAAQDSGYIAAKAAYEASVVELQALLGENAHCNEVDCDLWSSFSDCYKSEYNFRPRGQHWTRAQVLKWFDDLVERQKNAPPPAPDADDEAFGF